MDINYINDHYSLTCWSLFLCTQQGFTIANNQAAKSARGKFLLFANIDMFVTAGALSVLLKTLSDNPSAAAVGPLFLGKDHIVQEAGGVIWEDATGANVGRGKVLNPLHYRLREVDYISAACVLVRRASFEQVGSFDQLFAPAYYEDSDLGMKFREHGWKVLLQPLAVVYHQEGSVFGDDESPVKKRLMAANRRKFLSKWGHRLGVRFISSFLSLSPCCQHRPQ